MRPGAIFVKKADWQPSPLSIHTFVPIPIPTAARDENTDTKASPDTIV